MSTCASWSLTLFFFYSELQSNRVSQKRKKGSLLLHCFLVIELIGQHSVLLFISQEWQMETEPKECSTICEAASTTLSRRTVVPWLETWFSEEKMNRKRIEEVFYLLYRLARSFRGLERRAVQKKKKNYALPSVNIVDPGQKCDIYLFLWEMFSHLKHKLLSRR